MPGNKTRIPKEGGTPAALVPLMWLDSPETEVLRQALAAEIAAEQK